MTSRRAVDPAATAAAMNTDALALSRACAALWTATLSLMTAFMQTGAPAHRYLIARRIARNLAVLREQDCFTAECRMSFSNLSQRWTATADQLAQREGRPRTGTIPAVRAAGSAGTASSRAHR